MASVENLFGINQTYLNMNVGYQWQPLAQFVEQGLSRSTYTGTHTQTRQQQRQYKK